MEDASGGVPDRVGVAVGPAGDVADAGWAGVQAEQAGDQMGDGLGFGLFDPPVLPVLPAWLFGAQDQMQCDMERGWIPADLAHLSRRG